MNIRRTIGTLALAASFALTGCDDVIGTGGDATIIVENNASISVREINISDCDDLEWGEDELGPTETIAPGEDRAFDVDTGCYDLRAEFLDDSFAEDFNIELDEGDEFTWELVD